MRSRSMNPFSAAVPLPSAVPLPGPAPEPLPAPPPASPPQASGGLMKLLNGFQNDDYIILGIIFVLFFEGCDDYLLIAALGYLFVMGIL